MGSQVADTSPTLVNDASTTPVDESFCYPPGVLPTGYMCSDYGSNISLWLMNYTASYMSCKSLSCDLRAHYRGMTNCRTCTLVLIHLVLFYTSAVFTSALERATPLVISHTGMVEATCHQPGDELQLSGCVSLVETVFWCSLATLQAFVQIAVVVGVIGTLVTYGIMLSDTSVRYA